MIESVLGKCPICGYPLINGCCPYRDTELHDSMSTIPGQKEEFVFD